MVSVQMGQKQIGPRQVDLQLGKTGKEGFPAFFPVKARVDDEPAVAAAHDIGIQVPQGVIRQGYFYSIHKGRVPHFFNHSTRSFQYIPVQTEAARN